VALLAAVLPSQAQTADLDALGLQVEPARPAAADRPWQLFAEAAAGLASQRNDAPHRDLHRLTLDGRTAGQWGRSTQYVLSVRVDSTEPDDPFVDDPVLSLREAYLGWQWDEGAYQLHAGRINLRLGPAYGYNPTDFFRDNALRSVTTVNPFTQRENRLGVVMLRGQRVWSGGSLTVALAPELDTTRSTSGIAADWGATNAQARGLVGLATRWSDAVSTQVMAYKASGAEASLGLNGTALLGDSLVGHWEWAHTKAAMAIDALSPAPASRSRSRAAVGMTFSSTRQLSITGEWQYNGFAADHAQWRNRLASDAMFASVYYIQSQALQDNASRHALLLYAVQREFLVKAVDLTVLVKHNETDRSRLFWVDLRHRWPKAELALQFQYNHGQRASEFGLSPLRASVGVVGTFYF
jgi:hypothetical protein